MNILKSKTYLENLQSTIKNVRTLNKLNNSKILITGASGTIGSFLLDVLLEYNATENAKMKIYAAGRNREKYCDRWERYGQESFEFLSYDMNSEIFFNIEVDYIIHLSGNAHPAAFCGDPVGTIIGNVNSTYNILEYAKNHNVQRVVYVSSGEVYGQGNIEMDSYDEKYSGYIDSLSPRSCYPLSKRVTENLCAAYSQQYGVDTVIVRPCHTYGPTVTNTDNRATVQFFNQAINGENIVLKSAGEQLRSYMYVADCVSALLMVMLFGNIGEAYNLANVESRLTIAEFANKIASETGVKVIFQNPTNKEIEQRSPISKQILDSKKLEQLGWKGQYSAIQGIVNMINIMLGK